MPSECFICKYPANTEFLRDVSGVVTIVCERCGKYSVSRRLSLTPSISDGIRCALSAATRDASESGQTLVLSESNMESLASPYLSMTTAARVQKLLKLLARKAVRPGSEVTMNPEADFPLAAAATREEFLTYLAYLEQDGLIHVPSRAARAFGISVAYKGWQQVEPGIQPGGIPGRCFVAMSLDPKMNDAYRSGILPAITDCEFDPRCMLDIHTNEGITDRILAEITQAQFVVADFTGQRQSVYFEAGFARGLGRPVIWTCHKDEIAKVHFDTRHFGHVLWADPVELRERLSDAIRSTIIRSA